MQYPQFRNKLLTIAAEEATHADWLADKIKLFGGKLPAVPDVSIGEKNSWRYLVDDLEDERRCSADLFEHIVRFEPELPRVAEILQQIYDDETRHRSELREMLIRSDPQSLWPA
jgi:rubrerythrin